MPAWQRWHSVRLEQQPSSRHHTDLDADFACIVNKSTHRHAIAPLRTISVGFRAQLSLEHDNEYGLYQFTTRAEEHGGRFSHIKDKEMIVNAVKGWTTADIEGCETAQIESRRRCSDVVFVSWRRRGCNDSSLLPACLKPPI